MTNINKLVYIQEGLAKGLVGLGLIYAAYRMLKNGNIDTSELDPKAKEVAKQIGQGILNIFNKTDDRVGPITDKVLSQAVSFSKQLGKEILKGKTNV